MENIFEYERLIYSIINKYPRFDRDDLYQVGMIGLMEAYNHYDSIFDSKFSTYAYYYIIGEVNKYIRGNSGVKISRDIIKLGKSINSAREIMQQRLGREPSDVELSLFLDIDEDKISDELCAMDIVSSLDYCDEDGVDLYNFIKIENKEMSPDIIDLKDEIMNLTEEERKLIVARYYNDLTQTETSRKLGISQVQVSRKENKILEKLRCRL